MDVKKLILQEEDGKFIFDIDLVISLTSDKKTGEILKLVNPTLIEKGFQVTEMSKNGVLDYNVTLLNTKTRKSKMYKLTHKILIEEDEAIKATRLNMKFDAEKERIKKATMSTIILENMELKDIENKESLNATDINKIKMMSCIEEEIRERCKKVEKVLNDIKIGKKNTEIILFLIQNLKDVNEEASSIK